MKAQEVLDLLSPIPSEQFCSYDYSLPSTQQCCAIGHLQRLASEDPDNYTDYNCNDRVDLHPIRNIASKYFTSIGKPGASHGGEYTFAGVNNNANELYPQKDQKERVVALLNDMIKAGF